MHEKKKKLSKMVLIISPFSRPNVGGVETHLDRLIEYLGDNGYYSVLLTYQPLASKVKGEKLERGKHYEIHRVQWYGVGLFDQLETKFPLVFLYVFPGLFVKSMFFYIKNHKKIDVIHAHGLVAATIGMFCRLIFRKRTVVSTHAIYMFENRKSILRILVKNILRFYDKIIAVSEVSRDELIQIGLPKNKVTCYRNWVNTNVFQPYPKDKLSVASDKKINFLMVARFIEKKGVLLYCRAAEKIKEANFYLVGAGPLEDQVRKIAENNDNLKYLGILNQEVPEQRKKLVELYSLADYFVSPYLYDEGYSITLCEAVCSGTKPVIPERGSPPTFLTKEVAVFMSAQINEKILADTLSGLINKPKTEESIKICREYGLEHLGFSNAKIITDAYEEK